MKSRMSVNLQTSFIQKLAKIQQEKVKIQQQFREQNGLATESTPVEIKSPEKGPPLQWQLSLRKQETLMKNPKSINEIK